MAKRPQALRRSREVAATRERIAFLAGCKGRNVLLARHLDLLNLGRVLARSVHPSTADIRRLHRHVRFVPATDSCTAANSIAFDHLELRTGGPMNRRRRPTERLVVARKCQIDNGLSTKDICGVDPCSRSRASWPQNLSVITLRPRPSCRYDAARRAQARACRRDRSEF